MIYDAAQEPGSGGLDACIHDLARCRACGGAAQAQDPALADIVKKVGDYVAAYGEKTSAIVGTEKYSQIVTFEGQPPIRPKQLLAEFAIVRAGSGWTGFRDVIEVNGDKVEDRKDRLEKLLAESTGSEADLMRIASENSRYNVGPISRNLGVPTAGLLSFQPANLARFTVTKKGSKKINGIDTVELEFKETQRPTMVMRRSGADVPMEGTLWVVPADGTVVRTRLKMKNFADARLHTGSDRRTCIDQGQLQRLQEVRHGGGDQEVAAALKGCATN